MRNSVLVGLSLILIGCGAPPEPNEPAPTIASLSGSWKRSVRAPEAKRDDPDTLKRIETFRKDGFEEKLVLEPGGDYRIISWAAGEMPDKAVPESEGKWKLADGRVVLTPEKIGGESRDYYARQQGKGAAKGIEKIFEPTQLAIDLGPKLIYKSSELELVYEREP